MPVRRFVEDSFHGLRQGGHVPHRDERSVSSVFQYLGRTGGTVGADAGTAAGHGLHKDHRKTFVYRGQHEQGGAGHEREGILHPPRQRHPVGEVELADESFEIFPSSSFAEDDQAARAPSGKPGESPEESGVVLFPCQSSRSEEHWRTAVQEPWMAWLLRGPFFGEPVGRVSQDEYANALRKAAMNDGPEQDDVNLVTAVAEATSKPVYYPFGAIAAEVENHECDMHGRVGPWSMTSALKPSTRTPRTPLSCVPSLLR